MQFFSNDLASWFLWSFVFLPVAEDLYGDGDTTAHGDQRHDEWEDHHGETAARCDRYRSNSNPNPCDRDPFTCAESSVHTLPPPKNGFVLHDSRKALLWGAKRDRLLIPTRHRPSYDRSYSLYGLPLTT